MKYINVKTLIATRTRLTLGIMATLILTPPACASSALNLGSAANYGLVDLGQNTTLSINSGPLTSVLVGNSANVHLSGGNNGAIPGGLYTDGTANISGSLQNPFTTTTVAPTLTQSAFVSAQSVSSYAAGLAATRTYGNLSNSVTITGNGGLNVIDVASIQNAPLTITGNSNDVFVFNISGKFQTNQAMTLVGVSPSQLLFNFTGTSGNVLQTSGGDVLYGTFLAADGGQFQFSELNLTGALINTGGDVQFVSGSKTTFSPFNSVPEPSMLGLVGVGFLSIALYRYRPPTSRG